MAQFRLADNLFRQKKYREAADEYLKNLNQFPETDASPNALANLALSYANLDDKLHARMVAEYLGERFSKSGAAAMALLAVGKFYFDRKDEPAYVQAYEDYLKYFPKHQRAAAILFTLAGMRKQAGDDAGAAKYYQRIVDNYPQDQYYTKSLSQMAWQYYGATNYAGAVKGFTAYLAEAQPSPDKAQAEFALAESYRRLDKPAEAIAEYEKLIQWIAPKNNPYATSSADVQKNAALLEKAVFQRAYSYSRIRQPAASIPEYRGKAIKSFEQFIALFPNSELAPKALNGKGTAQLEIGQFDVAAKTFDELAAKYPESDEGKSALFALVRSAMEIKQYDQAKSAFGKMMGNQALYTADQFARIGQAMLDAGLYEQAIEAFEQVVRTSEERALLERALYGLGRAHYELKDYPARSGRSRS